MSASRSRRFCRAFLQETRGRYSLGPTLTAGESLLGRGYVRGLADTNQNLIQRYGEAALHSAVLLEDNTIADIRREREDSRSNQQT